MGFDSIQNPMGVATYEGIKIKTNFLLSKI